MQQDQFDRTTSTTEETEGIRPPEPDPTLSDLPANSAVPATSANPKGRRFDWSAVGVVMIIAAIFAALAHLNAQPAASLAPAAVLSATGCGLLITGLRKLRTFKGVGTFEAALSGLLLALFQFISALAFPGVTRGLASDQTSRAGFFTTWILVVVFATLFSTIGAALGHLIFAPLRPLPARANRKGMTNTGDEEEAEQAEDLSEPTSETDGLDASEDAVTREGAETVTEEVQPARSPLSYIISIVLLGLAPFLAGYVFAAVFDVALNLNQYDPGPFPTLRLLSALLPWQVALPPIDLQSLNLTLAWRIPFLPGNPGMFDMQALEPFILNAAGLACTLLALFRLELDKGQTTLRDARRTMLLLEALLGLVMTLPADLWIAFGLHGLLQLPSIAVLLRTLQLLNPFTFTLNLITAPLLCIIVGIAIVGMRRNSINYSQQ